MISFCFAGFDRHLPGFDRYSVLGDDSDGSFNLKVVSAVKDDEAKYECQVGPGKEILQSEPALSSPLIVGPYYIHIYFKFYQSQLSFDL